MNRWKGVVEFVAIVEGGSFSKAAEQLGISVSQVSKRVSELEDRLGARLIHRSTRSINLSERGKTYYESCKKILEEFDRAEDEIGAQQDEAQGLIRMCVVGGTRPSFQVDILAGFLKQNPGISLEVLFLDEICNLIEENIDLCLVAGPVTDIPFPVARLAWIDYCLCVSPKYMEDKTEPEHPSELDLLDCIRSNAADNWRLHDGNGDSVEVEISGNFISSNMRASIEACRAGLGVYMIPSYNKALFFGDGNLVSILDDWRIRVPLNIVTPTREYIPKKLRMLNDYLSKVLIGTGEGSVSGVMPAITDEKLALVEEMKRSADKEIKEI